MNTMNTLPDISGNDSERLQELVRVTTREVKAVGGASAGTTLDMIGYIRELEHELNTRRASVAAPQGDVDEKAREIVEGCSNWHDIQYKIVPRITAALRSSVVAEQKDEKTVMATVPHHPLCGREILPAKQSEPQLTALQAAAYSQGVEDALCAIRAESQGGGYWAATYINAIARRCSPFWYVGARLITPTYDQVVQAITDIQEARESHVQWATHLRAPHTVDCQGCTDHATHIGDAKYHDEWIAKYDNAIAVLARVPFATTSAPATSSTTQAGEVSAAPVVEHDWQWYDRNLRATGYTDLANRMLAEFKPDRIRAAAPLAAEPEYVVIDGERRRVIPCPDGKPDCEVLHTVAATPADNDAEGK